MPQSCQQCSRWGLHLLSYRTHQQGKGNTTSCQDQVSTRLEQHMFGGACQGQGTHNLLHTHCMFHRFHKFRLSKEQATLRQLCTHDLPGNCCMQLALLYSKYRQRKQWDL